MGFLGREVWAAPRAAADREINFARLRRLGGRSPVIEHGRDFDGRGRVLLAGGALRIELGSDIKIWWVKI